MRTGLLGHGRNSKLEQQWDGFPRSHLDLALCQFHFFASINIVSILLINNNLLLLNTFAKKECHGAAIALLF